MALFLASANANDADETIETAAKIADNLSLLFGIAVIVGVAAEYLLSAMGLVGWWNWPGASVALGVAGEIAFARRGSKLSGTVSDRLKSRLATATKESAAALERALAAEQEIARLKLPRYLNDSQKSLLRKHLANVPPGAVYVRPGVHDGDAEDFGDELKATLIDGGIQVAEWPGETIISWRRGGVFMLVTDMHAMPPHAIPLMSALKSAGIEVLVGMFDPTHPPFSVSICIGTKI